MDSRTVEICPWSHSPQSYGLPSHSPPGRVVAWWFGEARDSLGESQRGNL